MLFTHRRDKYTALYRRGGVSGVELVVTYSKQLKVFSEGESEGLICEVFVQTNIHSNRRLGW